MNADDCEQQKQPQIYTDEHRLNHEPRYDPSVGSHPSGCGRRGLAAVPFTPFPPCRWAAPFRPWFAFLPRFGFLPPCRSRRLRGPVAGDGRAAAATVVSSAKSSVISSAAGFSKAPLPAIPQTHEDRAELPGREKLWLSMEPKPCPRSATQHAPAIDHGPRDASPGLPGIVIDP